MPSRRLLLLILLVGCELGTLSLGEAPVAREGVGPAETGTQTTTGGTHFTTSSTSVTTGEGGISSVVVERVCTTKCQHAALCNGTAVPSGCSDLCIAEMPFLSAECEAALDAYYGCLDPGQCTGESMCADEANRVLGLCSQALCNGQDTEELAEVGGPIEPGTTGFSLASCQYTKVCRGNMFMVDCEQGECTCFFNREVRGSCPQMRQCAADGLSDLMPFSAEALACCAWPVAALLPG